MKIPKSPPSFHDLVMKYYKRIEDLMTESMEVSRSSES